MLQRAQFYICQCKARIVEMDLVRNSDHLHPGCFASYHSVYRILEDHTIHWRAIQAFSAMQEDCRVRFSHFDGIGRRNAVELLPEMEIIYKGFDHTQR